MDFTTILLLLVVSVGTVCSQMIHSIDRIHRVVELKGILALQLQEYLVNVDDADTIVELQILIKKLKKESEGVTKEGLEKEMSHPVRMFRFFSSLAEHFEDIDSLVTDRSLVNINATLEELPDEFEYVSCVKAIARLQEIYGDAADFSRPQGDNHEDVLSADELFEIGEVCSSAGNHHCAYNNLKRAKKLYEEDNDIPAAMLAYDDMIAAVSEQGSYDYALNYTYDLLKYYEGKDDETVNRLKENVEIYTKHLGGKKEAQKQVILTKPYNNPNARAPFPHYNELCNGKTVETEDKETRPLQCHMYTNNNHPLLIISPAKKEDLDTKTGLSFFHHVLTDREIKILKEMAAKKFEDSRVVHDPNDESIKDQALYDDRSSNTGWIFDNEDSTIEALSKRVAAILDLSLSSSEPFQVLSYGIGGFYLPHYDWNHGEDPFPDYDGNRIATWIFYLNDVEKGGATVFPELGVTVWPEKGGAAFWRNLYYNGEGDTRTLHAACPLLEGYKWASNKWFHTGGNEFTWSCKTDPTL